MNRKIKAIVLDWAGTTVDYGSMAPVAAFREAFEAYGLFPSNDLIRRFMGIPKKDHVRNMLQNEEMIAAFTERFGEAPDETNVELIYEKFEPALFEVIKEHAKPLPGVLETIAELREKGLLIGSTTGYTREMMDELGPASEVLGYKPDCLVCPDDVGGKGRPFPYMIWECLRQLGVVDIHEAVKIGDTAADILEGKNAGCLSFGVILGSNMLGLSEIEYEAASQSERDHLAKAALKSYEEAGADHVLERFSDVNEYLLI
jgi:phosphonoacetaldehyde hydrolase